MSSRQEFFQKFRPSSGADASSSDAETEEAVGTPMNRRDFLHKSATVAAGTAIGLAMVDRAVAAEKESNEPNAFDYEGLEKEGAKEALQEPRQMIFISMISEHAKVQSDEYGVSPTVGTQKATDGTQDFLNNVGANVNCKMIDEVILIPNSVYADEGENGGNQANAFTRTEETSGSWLDQQLTAAAEKHGVPRENIMMVFYIKNRTDGGAAWTNYGHNGYSIETETALKVGTSRVKLQAEIHVHEMGKKITRKADYASWDVPTNSDGSLMYDLRERVNDSNAPKKIETCESPGGTLIRRVSDTQRDDADGNPHTARLFDHKSQQWIDVPLGGETWHSTDWKWAMDKYTTPRTEEEPPESHGESLDIPYLGELSVAALIANDPGATDIKIADGALPSFATRDGDSITFDWEAILDSGDGAASITYTTVDENGTESADSAVAMLTFKNDQGFTVDVATIDAPTAAAKIYPTQWNGSTPLWLDIANPNDEPVVIHVADIVGHQMTLPIDRHLDGQIDLRQDLNQFINRAGHYIVSVKIGNKVSAHRVIKQ